MPSSRSPSSSLTPARSRKVRCPTARESSLASLPGRLSEPARAAKRYPDIYTPSGLGSELQDNVFEYLDGIKVHPGAPVPLETFFAVDSDGSGMLDKIEWEDLMQRLNLELTQEQVTSFFDLIDDDHSGGIHVMEFSHHLEMSRKMRNSSEKKVFLSRILNAEPMRNVMGQLRRWQSHPLLRPIIRRPENMKTFADGEIIFSKGTHGRSMYFIAEGVVEFYYIMRKEPRKGSPMGEVGSLSPKSADARFLPLGACSYGDIFGEGALLTIEPRTLSAVAKGTTVLRELPADEFEAVLPKAPDLQRQFEEFAKVTETNRVKEQEHLIMLGLDDENDVREHMANREDLSQWEQAALHAAWVDSKHAMEADSKLALRVDAIKEQKAARKEKIEAQLAEVEAKREEEEAREAESAWLRMKQQADHAESLLEKEQQEAIAARENAERESREADEAILAARKEEDEARVAEWKAAREQEEANRLWKLAQEEADEAAAAVEAAEKEKNDVLVVEAKLSGLRSRWTELETLRSHLRDVIEQTTSKLSAVGDEKDNMEDTIDQLDKDNLTLQHDLKFLAKQKVALQQRAGTAALRESGDTDTKETSAQPTKEANAAPVHTELRNFEQTCQDIAAKEAEIIDLRHQKSVAKERWAQGNQAQAKITTDLRTAEKRLADADVMAGPLSEQLAATEIKLKKEIEEWEAAVDEATREQDESNQALEALRERQQAAQLAKKEAERERQEATEATVMAEKEKVEAAYAIEEAEREYAEMTHAREIARIERAHADESKLRAQKERKEADDARKRAVMENEEASAARSNYINKIAGSLGARWAYEARAEIARNSDWYKAKRKKKAEEEKAAIEKKLAEAALAHEEEVQRRLALMEQAHENDAIIDFNSMLAEKAANIEQMRVWHTHALLSSAATAPRFRPRPPKGGRSTARSWTSDLHHCLSGAGGGVQRWSSDVKSKNFSICREKKQHLREETHYAWEMGFVGPETVNSTHRGSAAVAVLSARATAERVTAVSPRGTNSARKAPEVLPPLTLQPSQFAQELANGIVRKQVSRERRTLRIQASKSWNRRR